MARVDAHGTGAGAEPIADTVRRQATAAGDETEAWRIPGFVAGFAGAAAVALVFLILDLGAGRPMWTPSALGSLLFRGESLQPTSGWVPALALGYTLIHGATFIGVGSIGAQLLSTRPGGRRISALTLGIGLFVAFEAVFLSFALIFDRGLTAELGAGPVALANLAAAAVMAWILHARSPKDGGL